VPTEPPPSKETKDSEERDESRVERALREIVRKVIEAGYERLSEGPENVRHLMSPRRRSALCSGRSTTPKTVCTASSRARCATSWSTRTWPKTSFEG
jgi:hypothetical protein